MVPDNVLQLIVGQHKDRGQGETEVNMNLVIN